MQNNNNNNNKSVVIKDLLKALNLREAQLNSNQNYQKKMNKKVERDSSQIPIQFNSNLQNISFYEQSSNKTKLDVTNSNSFKKYDKKFANLKHSKGVNNELLNDPFKIISTELSKTENKILKNKLIDDKNIDLNKDLNTGDLIHKAKIQLNQLNTSFEQLIKYQKSKTNSPSIDELEFNARNLRFNQNIKAYVDVCCQNPNMVIQFHVFIKY